MSNSFETNKGNTLIVVEGEFEEDNFNFLCDLYSGLGITKQSIIIYRTNIYNLHSKIVKEYGDDWISQDIDIAYLLTKDEEIKLRKTNFVNIYLIFDFERQDTFYDDEKIVEMQNKFNDPTDNGKLYINFPMVESFLDFESQPDKHYLTKRMNMDDYKQYKNKTKSNSYFWKDITAYSKILELLKEMGKNVSREHAWKILSDDSKLNEILSDINYRETPKNVERCFRLKHLLSAYNKEQYKEKMIRILNYCINKTIEKSILIQNGFVSKKEYSYNEIDFNLVLSEEIKLYNLSKEIYVLGTWLLLVPEYNSNLIEKVKDL